jgi:hypothetical protein
MDTTLTQTTILSSKFLRNSLLLEQSHAVLEYA